MRDDEPSKDWTFDERLGLIYNLSVALRTRQNLLADSDVASLHDIRLTLIAIETLSGLRQDVCELNRELFHELRKEG